MYYLCGMSRYVISNEQTKDIKSLILKHSQKITINNDRVRGVYTIKSFRKYQFRIEVDVEFKGEIHARFGHQLNWYDSSVINQKNGKWKISKIKLNRFLRKSISVDLRTHLNYFSESFKFYSDIKKIQWL
jgi:hypothetical protein